MIGRHILSVAAMVVLLLAAKNLQAQTVDMSLDLYYSNPADANSAGTWQFVAKASHRGLASLATQLTGVNPGPVFEAPWGSGTGVSDAGFHQTIGPFLWDHNTDANPVTLEMLFAQVPVAFPGPQGLFYDVGIPGGATQPGENGTPAIAGFVPGDNIPWNFTDTLGDLFDDNILNDSGPFEGGVLLASGTFGANSSPAINSSASFTGANVFTALGTTSDPPPIDTILQAAFTTQIRDNTFLAGIPEPSTLALAGLACAMLALRRIHAARQSPRSV